MPKIDVVHALCVQVLATLSTILTIASLPVQLLYDACSFRRKHRIIDMRELFRIVGTVTLVFVLVTGRYLQRCLLFVVLPVLRSDADVERSETRQKRIDVFYSTLQLTNIELRVQ